MLKCSLYSSLCPLKVTLFNPSRKLMNNIEIYNHTHTHIHTCAIPRCKKNIGAINLRVYVVVFLKDFKIII